jgi:molybdopterin-guanine dinucleotide biosynthesis protein A
MNDNNILGVVLAGGKSKRFGEDKNCIKLGSKTLLEHVLFKINNKFEETLIVSSNPLKIQITKKIPQ